MKKHKIVDGGSQFMEAFVERVIQELGILKRLERAESLLERLNNGHAKSGLLAKCTDCKSWIDTSMVHDYWICACNNAETYHCGCDKFTGSKLCCISCTEPACEKCMTKSGLCDMCA